MENSLADKVAIVTGAGRGIGRSIAIALAQHGARVVLAARTAAQLLQVQDEIAALGGDALVVAADIGVEQDVIALVRQAIDHYGRLDIVVNNAGIGMYGPLENATTVQWDAMMNINARGTFLMCREAIPHLRLHKTSYIVNITSVVGVKGYVNQALYSASKHAVMGMSKALAKEMQKDGIRVHAICPGGVDTDMASQARPDLDRTILIQPAEIADVVLFLVTRAGNAVIDQIDMRRETGTPWA
jgi:3-oxoacyl-[acyl-carrier protein] reductase